MTSLLLSCAIKATLVFALAALIALFTGRKSAALRHQVWAVAILAVLLLPLFAWAVPAWHWSALSGTALPAATGQSGRLAAVTITVLGRAPRSGTMGWLIAAWAAGFACVLLRFAADSVRLLWTAFRARPFVDEQFRIALRQGSAKTGVTRRVHLLISDDEKAMPSTWGWAQPRILLPANCLTWPEERREMVLAHELAHIARLDWPVRLAAELMRAAYWVHPLAWLAVAKLREESERACDDAVLASGQNPTRYASELLGLVRSTHSRQQTWSTALAVARKSNLEGRFTAMLDTSMNRRRLTRTAATLTATTALFVLIPLAAVRAPAQEASGKITGTVYDTAGKGMPNAAIIVTNTEKLSVETFLSDATGAFESRELPAGKYKLRVLSNGVDNVNIKYGYLGNVTVTLEAGAVAEANPNIADQQERILGDVAAAGLTRKVQPVYPSQAKQAGIQGAVKLEAVISKEGVPLTLRPVSGPPELVPAALDAVRQWLYKPVLLNGNPVEVQTTVIINFTLAS